MSDPTPRDLERHAEDEWLAAQRDLAGLDDADIWMTTETIGGGLQQWWAAVKSGDSVLIPIATLVLVALCIFGPLLLFVGGGEP